MPGQPCTIAVDIGTTTVKAVALTDTDERQIAQRRIPLDTWTDDAGAAEQDPAVVYDAVTGALAATAVEARR